MTDHPASPTRKSRVLQAIRVALGFTLGPLFLIVTLVQVLRIRALAHAGVSAPYFAGYVFGIAAWGVMGALLLADAIRLVRLRRAR